MMPTKEAQEAAINYLAWVFYQSWVNTITSIDMRGLFPKYEELPDHLKTKWRVSAFSCVEELMKLLQIQEVGSNGNVDIGAA